MRSAPSPPRGSAKGSRAMVAGPHAPLFRPAPGSLAWRYSLWRKSANTQAAVPKALSGCRVTFTPNSPCFGVFCSADLASLPLRHPAVRLGFLERRAGSFPQPLAFLHYLVGLRACKMPAFSRRSSERRLTSSPAVAPMAVGITADLYNGVKHHPPMPRQRAWHSLLWQPFPLRALAQRYVSPRPYWTIQIRQKGCVGYSWAWPLTAFRGPPHQ